VITFLQQKSKLG